MGFRRGGPDYITHKFAKNEDITEIIILLPKEILIKRSAEEFFFYIAKAFCLSLYLVPCFRKQKHRYCNAFRT